MKDFSFRPIQQCKKDQEQLDYKKINNDRENINVYEKNIIKKNNISKNKYNKEEFINEFNKLHNDMYFNPYEILNIEKTYTIEILKKKYKEQALIYHPDRENGDINKFKDITKSYLYLLKKYKENIPDKQIYDLKKDFNNYVDDMKDQKNILMDNDNFDIKSFHKIFDEYNIKENDDGYGNFMKNGVIEEKEEDTYIFSDNFNVEIFNKIFNQKIKKLPKNEVQIYKEPETLFQSNSGYVELGEDKVTDYSSLPGFNKKLNYTDCKIAYSEPIELEDNIEVFDSLEELKTKREDLSYKMDNKTENSYNLYLNSLSNNEEQRLNKIKRDDIRNYQQYDRINKKLLK